MEALKQIIQTLSIGVGEKEILLQDVKAAQKALECAEFRYKRTLIDKEAITNILNASLEEIGKQKKIIEEAKNKINAHLLELDKQKREAQIEAALERVRSKTMAMRKSVDIGKAMSVMFDELSKLGIESLPGCGVVIFDETYQMEVWKRSGDEQRKFLAAKKLDVQMHSDMLAGYIEWKKKAAIFSCALTGKDAGNFHEIFGDTQALSTDLRKEPPGGEILKLFYFLEGALYVYCIDKQLDADAEQLFIRFAGVFSLTYRRFLDIQKAELAAKEALKQASLDRVRAEIASMRTTSDLDRITPLIWNELTNLGVSFMRCGVFFISEAVKRIDVYLSTPEGRGIAAFQLPFNSREEIAGDIVEHWRHHQTFVVHWDAAAFSQWTKSLVTYGAINQEEKYVTDKPPENLYLHFLPFLQGMLYVGSASPLSEGEMALSQSLADAFSTAYARYDDFSKLETAKRQLEKTLAELKATQQQLIHQEKMASLGELTAGIAHEIQNPLNFVNNFSTLNKELLFELRQEFEKGNYTDVKAIAQNLQENEEKINHHGRRAECIVKSMLQHSKISNGKKEPININALVEEYLRLSYQGLRAKDKEFKADIQTNFDSTILQFQAIPQDIGRALLNLFNNAFYAVHEKMKRLNGEYEPIVQVCTCKKVGGIEIHVKDNGIGIPEKILQKIYQPFFTTKPTGEGTGLGLSLCYDIIKNGYGGELKVKSTEGEGAEFVVKLPAR